MDIVYRLSRNDRVFAADIEREIRHLHNQPDRALFYRTQKFPRHCDGGDTVFFNLGDKIVGKGKIKKLIRRGDSVGGPARRTAGGMLYSNSGPGFLAEKIRGLDEPIPCPKPEPKRKEKP